MLPNLIACAVQLPDPGQPSPPPATHKPRILMLYGLLRPQSYGRALAHAVERRRLHYGADVRVFDPHGLPGADSVGTDHPGVQQRRAWSRWSEGQVWIRPERHGTVSAVFKNHSLTDRCSERKGDAQAPASGAIEAVGA